MAKGGPKTNQLAWDDLRTALFLARAGSVRRAARELGVSHSTVLRRLRALESAMGAKLFVDTGEGYETTPAGQDVFDTATQLEDSVVGLGRRVGGHDARLTGPVRVTLPDPFMPMLAPVFAEFARAQPGIEITVALGTHYVDLAHRAADVAVRIAEAPPPDLVGQKVCRVATAVYGSAEHLRGRSTRSLDALEWVDWERGSEMAFARWREQHHPKARVALRVDAGWAFREAIDAGVGVAIAPCALGETMPGWRRVRPVPEVSAPLWVLTHRDLRTTARVRVVRDFLVDALRSRRALIEGRTPARQHPRARSV